MKRTLTLLTTLALAALALGAFSQQSTAPAKKAAKPNVAGAWTGVWGMFAPGKPGSDRALETVAKLQCQMDSKIEETPDGKWSAVFEGECGKPYKYTIKMVGRQAGDAVLFQGSADLGELDGGVFDWIGRATEKDVTGFFTSKGYSGYFRLTRTASPGTTPSAASTTAAKPATPKK